MTFFKLTFLAMLFYGQIVTGFKSSEKAVCFTFDACETVTPAYFDKDLLNYIIENKIPATLFLSGRFIERNLEKVKALAKYDFIEVENHSYSHANFKKLGKEAFIEDLKKNELFITEVLGRKPKFYRFPYGEYSEENLREAQKAGYKVVHWAFPSGDPDKSLTKEGLVSGVINRVKSGDILIFHINGRGWKTKEAFPEIVEVLRRRGYRFLLLKDVLN